MKTNIFLILFTLVFSFEIFGAFPVSEIDSLQSVSTNVNIEHVILENTNTKAMTMEVVTMFVLAGIFLAIATIWLISKLVAAYNCLDSYNQTTEECSKVGEHQGIIILMNILALLGFIFFFKGVNDYYKNKRSLKNNS
tara:strand:- start:3434 stop:3847 length:414 start_codon:yes stop_codon:yes gene_type:complete